MKNDVNWSSEDLQSHVMDARNYLLFMVALMREIDDEEKTTQQSLQDLFFEKKTVVSSPLRAWSEELDSEQE